MVQHGVVGLAYARCLCAFVVSLVAATLSAQTQAGYAAKATPIAIRCSQRGGCVEDFVRRSFPEGIHYNAALKFANAKSARTLLKMLSDPREAPFWENIVLTLGIIADPEAIDPLGEFLRGEESVSPVSDELFAARSNVLLAYGCAINRIRWQKPQSVEAAKKMESARTTAMKYLTGGLQPGFWDGIVRWKSPYHETSFDRNLHLTRLAMQGLGLSGSPEALEKLNWLRDHLKHAASLLRREGRVKLKSEAWIENLTLPMVVDLSAAVDNAIELHQKVRIKGGLERYYTQ